MHQTFAGTSHVNGALCRVTAHLLPAQPSLLALLMAALLVSLSRKTAPISDSVHIQCKNSQHITKCKLQPPLEKCHISMLALTTRKKLSYLTFNLGLPTRR